MPTLPDDYVQRVYAGVLGKLIGVYLGRPFEGWSCDAITDRFGAIDRYVHDDLGAPLIVADDDISGTFTFLRAFEDGGCGFETSAEAIGDAWLNYIVPLRTVLWWGGIGVSTEHTAFANLAAGIPAPSSGSAERNGRLVAEQIGAQIFIDGWGLVSPGDPALAARLARRAGSVSHDGAALDAAASLAAMEAAAFFEADIDRLLDIGVAQIDPGCLVRRLIDDLREWHAQSPADWRAAFARVRETYGYDRYGGGCHIVPNHALIVLALLYGGGDFGRSLTIVNTCGWDTDCNSGNVGCLLGVRGGLAAIDTAAYDWRGPIADRLYLPTADGGRCATDAAREALRVANMALKAAGRPPAIYKDGARYHFALPGSVQGWSADGGAAVENVAASAGAERALAVRIPSGLGWVYAAAETMPPASVFEADGYGIVACPALSPGQRLRCRVSAPSANDAPVEVALAIARRDGAEPAPRYERGESAKLLAGDVADIAWTIPDRERCGPIERVGLAIRCRSAAPCALLVDRLGWDGPPRFALRFAPGDPLWNRGWVDAVDSVSPVGGRGGIRVRHGDGVGLLIHGSAEWSDTAVRATIRPVAAEAFGVAVRVEGLRRYYAFVLGPENTAGIVRQRAGSTLLASADFEWSAGREYDLRLECAGDRLFAAIDGRRVLECTDTPPGRSLSTGAIALVAIRAEMIVTQVQVGAESAPRQIPP